MSKPLPAIKKVPLIDPLYQTFLAELKPHWQGDISEAYGDRLVASCDNSVYQVLPQAVLHPKNKNDVRELMTLMTKPLYQSICIMAKGGGTGTNGQSLGTGLVVDFSRHMNQILEIDLDHSSVRVQPGVVLDQLNQALKKYGVFFAPNLSPSTRATLGGMCATDACGKGSRVYGRTSDHILALEVDILGKGAFLLAPHDDSAPIEGPLQPIYAVLDSILTTHQEDIEQLYPDMPRFLTGYNLTRLKRGNQWHLPSLIAGSEGTLALVTELTLKLTPLPKVTELVLIKYDQFADALKGAEELVSYAPHAIETIDDTIIDLAKKDILWHQVEAFFKGPHDERLKAINLVEFSGDSQEELLEKIKKLQSALAENKGVLGSQHLSDSKDQQALWNLRKKGVGLLGNREGLRRPIPFVEDTAVPPAFLGAYIEEFRALLDSYGLSYGMFGHVDVGCLHVRPALDLKNPQDERIFRDISDQVKDLVKKYRGIMWAEHGRGFRSEYTEEFFGPKLYQALKQIKKAFDPHNQLNPGKIVSPHDQPLPKLDQVPLRGQRDRVIEEDVQEDFAKALQCNGNGACFHFDAHHVMCPSMKVTRERIHSPKGRATILREWLRQLAIQDHKPSESLRIGLRSRKTYDFSHEVYDAMKGCLACKACATQCPIQVDIPELKSRFLASYHQRYRRPLFDYAIGFGEALHSALIPLAPLYNGFMSHKLGRAVLKKTLGMISPPLLSTPPLKTRLLGHKALLSKEDLGKDPHQVILVQDAMTSLYEADIVLDFVHLCHHLGYRVFVSKFQPNGKGFHVKGMRGLFRFTAKRQLSELNRLASSGVPLVGLDPALTLTYREEYPQNIGPTPKVYLVHEWLALTLKEKPAPSPFDRKHFGLLSHCGEQTSAARSQKYWQDIFTHFGFQLDLLETGCCGMAGAYGHDVNNLQNSQGIYAMSYEKKLRSLPKEITPLASGASCRSQIARFSQKSIIHPISALWQAIETEKNSCAGGSS